MRTAIQVFRSTRNGVRPRVTFRHVVETTRVTAALNAWERAVTASGYRRMAVATGDRMAALCFGGIKCRAAQCAAELAPEHVRLRIDDDYQIGLVSIEWLGRGRMHLPANTDTTAWRRR